MALKVSHIIFCDQFQPDLFDQRSRRLASSPSDSRTISSWTLLMTERIPVFLHVAGQVSGNLTIAIPADHDLLS